MITPGPKNYEVVLSNTYYLRELVEQITLEDNLSEIAYCAQVTMTITPDFPGIATGQEARVSGVPFNGKDMVYLLHPGVVWECSSVNTGLKRLSATIYDRSIHLVKSEDDYFFPAGQTATQRIQKYASDWNIKIKKLENTKVALAKAPYRGKTLVQMIMSDLKETVAKGGDMYRLRMVPEGLELVKLGSNSTVWVLEESQNIDEVTQNRTLESAVTRVKILGKEPKEGRSPVLAIVDGEISKYGTIQKVLQYDKATSTGEATKKAKTMLAGEEETFVVSGIDINTIRAGDLVSYNNSNLIVCSIRHELGSPGKMTLELASSEYIKRRYYLDD